MTSNIIRFSESRLREPLTHTLAYFLYHLYNKAEASPTWTGRQSITEPTQR